MATKGYHSYRGRQGIWRRVLAVFLVLILLAACAFLLLQRYITYSDDGSIYLDLPFEFDLPFLQEPDDSGDNEDPKQDVDLIVENPVDPPSGSEDSDPDTDLNAGTDPEPDSEPEQPVIETYIPRRLVELHELPADPAALNDLLTEAGADGFSFIVKDREGYVSFSSSVALPQATANAAVTREQLAALCAQEGVYTVARISCLRDPIFALENINAASIRNRNGYAWFENGQGGHWLEPEKALTREYLIGLAVECAELGFDELLLEDVCYPYLGNLYKIVWEKEASKTEALVLFLTELNAALEPYGVCVSLLLDDVVVRGLAENTVDTGFVPEVILPLVDAVYVETPDPALTQQEMTALMNDRHTPALIPVVSAASAEETWYLISAN